MPKNHHNLTIVESQQRNQSWELVALRVSKTAKQSTVLVLSVRVSVWACLSVRDKAEKPLIRNWCDFVEICAMVNPIYTVSQKVPTFKLSVTLSNINAFSKFLHYWKATQHYPPHFRHVATLRWDMKNSNFLQIFSRYGKMQTNCSFSLLTLLFIHKF